MTFLSDTRAEYLDWVNDDKFLVINKFNIRTLESQAYAFLCSKRGNATYRRRVLRRFGTLARQLQKLHFFNPLSPLAQYTPALWVTLTYDPKLATLQEAWKTIAKDFNRFRANLQKQFGNLSLVRIFEATRNGYPHIHAILVFHDHLFNAFPKFSRRHDRLVWRVQETENIKKYWHSFIDVQAVHSLDNPLRYLKKYLTKSITAETKAQAVINTLAMTWKFKRRSFALSSDLIKALHISKPYKKTVAQTNLLGETLDEIEVTVVGVVPRSVLGIKSRDSWIKLNPDQQQEAWNYCLDRRKT